MVKKENINVLSGIWNSCELKNYGNRGSKSKELLQQMGFDYTRVPIGYVNHEKKRYRNNRELQAWLDIGFIKETGRQTKGKAPHKSVFAANGIIVPLKNKEHAIVNFYCLSSYYGNYSYLFEQTGLYPHYPHTDTVTLIVTETPEDAISILHTSIINQCVQVVSLHNKGYFNNEHISAFKTLEHVKHIIFAFPQNNNYCMYVQDCVRSIFPYVNIEVLIIPNGFGVHEFWKTYGSESLEYIFADIISKETLIENTEVLHIINPQLIAYKGSEAFFEVRGFLPHNLGQMELTLVTVNSRTNKKDRCYINLYNYSSIQKYVCRLAEREGYNAENLETDVLHLTDLLESHRDASFNKTSYTEQKSIYNKEFTSLAQKKAIETLSHKNIIQILDKKLEHAGIVGENDIRLTAFLIALTYKMPQQLHGIIQGESGSGKSHMLQTIARCLPIEDTKNVTRISEKALQNMAEHELQHKVLLIEDLDGVGNEALFALRELQSSGKFVSSIAQSSQQGTVKTITKDVYASMSSLATTTKPHIYFDNMTRSIILGVDESVAQTYRIIDYQNKIRAGLSDTFGAQKAQLELRNIVRAIQSYRVVNPYAHRITLPVKAKMLRRLHTQFHVFIEQIALVHQYQKNRNEQNCIVVEKSDIEYAISLFFNPLFLKIDDLDSSTRNFFEIIKGHVGKETYNQIFFTQHELRELSNKSKSLVARYCKTLVDLGYFTIYSGSINKGYSYKIEVWDELEKYKSLLLQELTQQVASL